jgi:hypothetical protein
VNKLPSRLSSNPKRILNWFVACTLAVVTAKVEAQPSYNAYAPSQAVDELQHVIGMCNEVPTLEMINRYQKDIDDNLAVLDSIPEAQPIATDYRQALSLIREADIMYAETQQLRDSRVKEERGKQESELRRKASALLRAAIELSNQLAPLLKASWERKRRNPNPWLYEPGRLNGKNQSTPSTPWLPNSPGNPSPPSNPSSNPQQPGVEGCPLPKIPVRTPIKLPIMVSNIQSSTDYRGTFFRNYPEFAPFQGNVVVHHAVPQAVLTKYPGYFTLGEMHSINNLRGICVPYKRPYIVQLLNHGMYIMLVIRSSQRLDRTS